MNVLELAKKLDFRVVNEGDGASREIGGVYCCDLLSVVMGRAKENDAWITVMGNMNSVAVAVLSDVACIIMSEDIPMDEQGQARAKEQNICVLASGLPTFEISQKIAAELAL